MATEFTRTFNETRKSQGFVSQAQLDAFFAHYDHVSGCPDCKALNSYVELSDGWQPTQGECPQARQLLLAYWTINNQR